MAQLFLLVTIPFLWTMFWLYWRPWLKTNRRGSAYYVPKFRFPRFPEMTPRWTPLRRMHVQRELDAFDERLNS